jgi:ubiquinone/menaquinone biosynthesis C-methylase UbiE
MQNSIPPIGAFDAFRHSDSWDAEEARYWISVLNQRAAAPDQIALRSFIIEQSDLRPGETVLEIGCGTGRLLSELAKATGAANGVIGLEPQSLFAKEAESFILEKKQSTIARVLCGSAEDIPLPDASIDICIAQTVLIHIPAEKLKRVFGEVKRVLKPGGRFISVDQDGDTWIIDHPDRVVTRKVVQFNCDYRYADGWTGRYLRRLFRQNGFQEVRVQAWTNVDTESGSYLHQMAQRIAQAATEHEILSQDECKKWLNELDQQTQKGNFFSSICFYCCQGRITV